MDKELRKKIKVDVVNNNIKEIIAMEKNGNSIGAYCLLIDKTIDSLKIKETINIDICYTTCSESADKIIDTEMMLEDYFDKVNILINQN